MFKIQTLNNIASVGLDLFPRKLYEVASDMHNPDAIIVRSHPLHEITFPKSVQVVGRAGAGTNNIPIATLTELGIPVFNTPGANANAVRELVIAGMLLASRHICQAWDYVNSLSGDNEKINHAIEQHKKQFVGFELSGKTVGVVGLGSVGVKVANAAMGLGMQVIGYDPTISVTRAWELSSAVKQAHSLDDLLMEADFVSFHIPLTDETKHLINRSRLHTMKTGAVILNFSRDGIIDNIALLEALTAKKIAAYVSDFPAVELKNHPQAICLPHIGASTKEAEDNCAIMIVKQVRDFLEQGSITHSVNFPTVEMPPNNTGIRLAITNANIPNMVAQMSSKLASAKINIISLLNKSCGDIAYTLIDVNTSISAELLKDIASIEGVIKVRKIKPQPLL